MRLLLLASVALVFLNGSVFAQDVSSPDVPAKPQHHHLRARCTKRIWPRLPRPTTPNRVSARFRQISSVPRVNGSPRWAASAEDRNDSRANGAQHG